MAVLRLACVFGCLGLLVAAGPDGGRPREGWVGTWATPLEGADGGHTFERQTLRQIVHVSVGGRRVRVRFSNLFGDRPLRIEDAHIARRQMGSTLVADTDRPLTFGGRPAVTIPVGQRVDSDGVDLDVPPLSDLAVSCYMPGPTGPSTGNNGAHQTSYVAAGDVSGSREWPADARPTERWNYLAEVDVQGGPTAGAVVAVGASITGGFWTTTDGNRRWTDVLARRLHEGKLDVGVLNAGINGNHLLADGSWQPAEQRFARDALGRAGVQWVIVADCPINDLGTAHPMPSGADLIAGYGRMAAAAHVAHVKLIGATLTPFEGCGNWSPAAEVARKGFNAFLRRAGNGLDGVVDADAATRDPAHPTRLLAAYDSGDHLHPNEAGLRAIGEAVDLALFKADGH